MSKTNPLLLLAEYEEQHELKSERLYLRHVELRDAEDMFEYSSNPKVTEYVAIQTNKTVEDSKLGIVQWFLSDPVGKYAIVLQETDKMIGTIDLRIKVETNSAELGYVLNADYQGKGFMTEAANLLLDLAFNHLDLGLVYAYCNAKNLPSENMMIRLGMKRDGVLRNFAEHKGEIIDIKHYSISKEEYVQG